MLTRRSRRKSRSYILFDESRMLRNERALFQTWLFKTPRYFFGNVFISSAFTISQTKSQVNTKVMPSPNFCILSKFIFWFLYILLSLVIVNGFLYLQFFVLILSRINALFSFFLNILLHYQPIGPALPQ